MYPKILLLAALLFSTAALVQAQDDSRTHYTMPSKAEATFNMYEANIHHRHSASLGSGNRMIIELSQYDDYQIITDLEAILRDLRSSLDFMDDSVAACPSCNYRIDYALNEQGMKSFRLRRYAPQGTFLYQKRSDDELKPFKPEADTLHLLLSGPPRQISEFPRPLGMMLPRTRMQVTFMLNRFANLDSLLARPGYLNGLVDTMSKAAKPRRRYQRQHPWSYESTINYTWMARNSDSMRKLLLFREGLGHTPFFWSHRGAFDAQLNFGAGLLRDQIAPLVEGGLVYYLPHSRQTETPALLGFYASCYTGFVRDAGGRYSAKPNIFLTAEFGLEDDQDFIWKLKTSRITFGIGYLIKSSGDFYTGTTMKACMNVRLRNGFTLSPEIIATENFRQVFPGLSLKVF